jgi:hypothetical protein
MTVRDDPPDTASVVLASLDDVAACMVRELNTALKSNSVLSHDITHQIQIIEPGRIYEILPQQQLLEGGEIYFVRLTADGMSTRIQGFRFGTWAHRIDPAIEKCRTSFQPSPS